MDPTSPPVDPVPLTAVTVRTGNQALTAIAIFKLAKAALCFAMAFGVFHVLHRDTQDELRKLLHAFRISGDRQFVKEVLVNASHIDLPHKEFITALLVFSGLMFTVEGTGLLLKKPWAEYFTVFLTGSGIPIELYELWRHANAFKFVALFSNVGIVIFLILHLVRSRRMAEQVRLAGLPPVREPEHISG